MVSTNPDASVGLHSPTELTKGATINKNITSLRNDIILGRKMIAEWDAGVKAWRSGGGDEIRAEYEAAFAERHG